MTENKTPPPPNVWPTLRANDAHGLIKRVGSWAQPLILVEDEILEIGM